MKLKSLEDVERSDINTKSPKDSCQKIALDYQSEIKLLVISIIGAN